MEENDKKRMQTDLGESPQAPIPPSFTKRPKRDAVLLLDWLLLHRIFEFGLED